MTLSWGVRKLTLAVHIAVSVGWLGAVAAYIALDLTAATSEDPNALRAAYVGMDLIVRLVIAPLAIASLVTGVVVSLGTRWGLFRHWWVVVSIVLTVLATVVLFVEMQLIGALAAAGSNPEHPAEHVSGPGSTLPHSIGGAVVLLAILFLNVYKPPGLTQYGWRLQRRERAEAAARGQTTTASGDA